MSALLWMLPLFDNDTVAEYQLSLDSECYNTQYFFCADFDAGQQIDTLFFVPSEIQDFVVEIGSIKRGEKVCFVYNDSKKIIIKNYGDYLRIGRHTIALDPKEKVFSKLSLYFVNDKMIVYVDYTRKYEKEQRIDLHKRIGVNKGRNSDAWFLYCYEPVPFKETNYGALLEDGQMIKSKEYRMSPHNVGAAYSLTFPTDITCNSRRAIRFEYRQEDSQNADATRMQRARSEISGVFSNSAQNKWIIEYDLYIPEETIDDNQFSEIITQLHEASTMSTVPSFSLSVHGGWLYCTINGDKTRIEHWGTRKRPNDQLTRKLIYLQKDSWHHLKIFIKEGWRIDASPSTKIWVDGELILENNDPNCYSYTPRAEGLYNYLKFGIYKSGWLMTSDVPSDVRVRTYYFDNFVVKY